MTTVYRVNIGFTREKQFPFSTLQTVMFGFCLQTFASIQFSFGLCTYFKHEREFPVEASPFKVFLG